MAGRNRAPHHRVNFQDFRDVPGPVLSRGHGPMPIHPAALEEELEMQHREIQKVIADNRHLMDENVALQREVLGAKDEIRHLSQVIPKLRADNDARARELIDRGLKLEAELHAAEPVRAQVIQLRAEVQKLNASRQGLTNEIEVISRDAKRMRIENEQLKALKSEIDAVRKDLAEARRAFELEKKANENLALENQSLENNLISMARELEKLRAERLNADRRAYGLGLSSYGGMNGVPEMRYPSGSYPEEFGGPWGAHDKYVPPHIPQSRYAPPRRWSCHLLQLQYIPIFRSTAMQHFLSGF